MERPPFGDMTRTALDAVGSAMEVLAGRTGAENISSKGGRDLVTAADIAVEDYLRDFLAERTGLPVVGEEQGGDSPDDGSPCWLIDPICGTRNLASGVPLYCINLALVAEYRVAAAVVADPSRGEVFAAEGGRGAWSLLGGAWRRLQTGESSQTLVVDDGKSSGERREMASRYTEAAMRADRWDFRSYGTTLASAYVAAGRVSGYVCFLVPALHGAAGTLLVTEAGGVVSDVASRPWTLDSDSLIAAAGPRLHSELLALR